MATVLGSTRLERVRVLGASLEEALHRCITLASPFGTILLIKPTDPRIREFVLEPEADRLRRVRWTLKSGDTGTELSVATQSSLAWLMGMGRHGPPRSAALEHQLSLLPRILNLRVVVLGGGTGLYTVLLGLRDRTWNLTAIVSRGLPFQPVSDPKDQLGSLPRDDASMSLVALAPSIRENLLLRKLLEHRMRTGEWQGGHFGALLVDALDEIQGSAQAGLDAATELLGIRGRIVLLPRSAQVSGSPPLDSDALRAIAEADMVVLAPGHPEVNVAVLCAPGIGEALRRSPALKVVVTKVMTGEGEPGEATTSRQLKALVGGLSAPFDVVVANSPAFPLEQLRAYAAVSARPLVPDPVATARFARRLVIQDLVAPGELARHDPDRIGACLIQVGMESFLEPGLGSGREVA